MKLSQDEIERHRVIDRQRAQFEANTLARLGAHERKEGEEVGLTRGRREGLIDKIHLLQRLLKQPLTPETELGNLDIEVLKGRAKELERLVLPDGNGAP
jgi:hypothetical protein